MRESKKSEGGGAFKAPPPGSYRVNSISNPIQKSNKNNLDVVQLAAMVKVICNSMTYSLYTTDIYK